MKGKLKSNKNQEFIKRVIREKVWDNGEKTKYIDDYFLFKKTGMVFVRVLTIWSKGNQTVRWEPVDKRGGVASLKYWMKSHNWTTIRENHGKR